MGVSKIALIALAIVVVYVIDETAGECCGACGGTIAPFGMINQKCNDCTNPTPYCAYGKCNIFGCNCDGGCRTGPGCTSCSRRRRTVFERTARHVEEQALESEKHLDSIFEVADVDGDGRLDRDESHAWVKRNSPDTSGRSERAAVDFFDELDTNHDGFLTRQEIDH